MDKYNTSRKQQKLFPDSETFNKDRPKNITHAQMIYAEFTHSMI